MNSRPHRAAGSSPANPADNEPIRGANTGYASRDHSVIWITGQHPLACIAIAGALDGLLRRRHYPSVILPEARLGGRYEPAFTLAKMRDNELRLALTADLFHRAGYVVTVCTGFRPAGWSTVAHGVLETMPFEVTLGEAKRVSARLSDQAPAAGPDCALAPKLSLHFDGDALGAASIAAIIAAKSGLARGL
ncbi:hypothetical protein [Paraburkholderia acidiphila]|uniref:Uncharacterized protein n=1 Tax=Paraburkholderia acidiphila TaxID=2571747 RepID=A0A7Z2G8A4_9BURK|nr:hypothetical protein [Paraburkholderia acidiphila]QGZ56599.1 hypothetical protein FAZ97_16640 [Paraburkholderia acidiphila]